MIKYFPENLGPENGENATPPTSPTARNFQTASIIRSFEGPPATTVYEATNTHLVGNKEEDRRTKGGGDYKEVFESSCKIW